MFLFSEIFLIVLIVSLIFYLSNSFFLRLDLTSEKKYSLSEFTRKMLRELDDYITVRLYFEGNLPPELKLLQQEIKYTLEEYKAYGKNLFNYEFINPHELFKEPKELNQFYENITKKGLAINRFPYYEKGETKILFIITGGFVYYGTNETTVDFLKSPHANDPYLALQTSVSQIEYELTQAILKLKKPLTCQIGLLKKPISFGPSRLNGFYTIASSLYQFKEISAEELLKDPLLNVLCIISPESDFSEQEKIAIDQFVMRGGNLLLCINGVEANMDSLATNNTMLVIPKSYNIDDLLMAYYIKITPTVVADLNCHSIPIITGTIAGKPIPEFIPWYYFPIALPYGNNKNAHTIVKNIDPVLFKFPSKIEIISPGNLSYSILYATSDNSRIFNAPFIIDLNKIKQKIDPGLFTVSSLPIGVLVEGEFKSAFALYESFYSLPKNFLKKSIKPSKIMVFGDGEIFANQINPTTKRPLPLGYDRYTNKMFGNAQLLMSVLNYLCGDTVLISLRNKNIRIRPLNQALISKKMALIQSANVFFPLILAFSIISIFVIVRRKTIL